MGKVFGIVLIILGVVLLYSWTIPFLDGVSPFGVIWNSLIGFILILTGIVLLFVRKRRN
jgi:LPXTG-motif cell wall-anchored protein